MKRTNKCPGCGQTIPTRWTYSPVLRDVRRCEHCGLLVFRVNTDVQPWTLMIGLVTLVPLMLSPLVGLLLTASVSVWAGIAAVVAGVAWALLIDRIQFPYTNGYVQWYPSCRDCGYDMRHSPDACPECGGQPTKHPEAVAPESNAESALEK